jgi:hypothetical protein
VSARAPTVVDKPWQPTPFGINVGGLPPNYQGIDPVKFFEIFKSRVGNLKKGEFETSEEFAQRTANIDSLLSPISSSDLYAFHMKNVSVKYDADAQDYVIDYSCEETYNFGEQAGWVTCVVAPISRENDTYVGSNAYGASRTIKRTRGRDFAIALPKGEKGASPLFAIFRPGRYLRDSYKYQDDVPVPLEQARSLKNLSLGVLFVGRITDAKLIEGRGTLVEPKIDSPNDIFIIEEALPFELKKVVYYVIQTGEIIGQRAH